ncbi:hypothetical protein NXS09_04985 [Neisseria sp. CSL10203-ORH2]|uniref:NADH dehydrogenase I subunit N n=2 Tax=Neisseria montereyensis TaxID=2973938 RepID=A0ABT2FD50_9NEIS|nr:hypothetical protein [Neisseria montereyensis]MCS4533654.1 hypothetical protein [Neisseria montereyensis]
MGRIIRIVFFLALIGLIAHRLFSRSQKRALHEVIQISAWVCVAAAVLAILWHWFIGF